MAPSPEQDKEPKAPDKNQSQASDSTSSDTPVQTGDFQQPSEVAGSAPGPSVETEESGQLESLDEGQLRILLDEAATYRRPKDREGKSLLFKELLQKAEQDSEAEWGAQCFRRARRSLGGGGGGRRSGARPPLTHSGSLQDLAEGGGVAGGGSGSGGGAGGRNGVGARSKHRQGRASRQVSARSQQGGSLPSNVDQQHNLSVVEGGRASFLEDVRCSGVSRGGGGDYIATVHCVNPSTEYYYTSHRADSPLHHYYTTEDLDIRSQPSSHVSLNYKSRATLEIGSPALDSDTSIISSAPANNISNSSNTSSTLTGHSCDENSNIGEDSPSNNNTSACQSDSVISTSPTTSSPLSSGSCPLQLASTYCSVKSVVGDEAPPVSVMSQGGGAAATTTVTSSVSHPITTASTASSQPNFLASCNMIPRISYQPGKLEDYKKSLDENGNAVQTVNATITATAAKRNKKKKCKNETETVSNEIDGYRGTEHINDILKFIESDAGDAGKPGGKTNNNGKANSSFSGKPSGREGKSKDDSHEKGTKKRSTERRTKDGMDKLKKSNSMEELSRSKLDDLTSSSSKDNLSLRKTKKQSTFDQPDVSDTKRNDRRSWGNDGSDSYYHDNNDDTLSINTSNSSSSQSSVSGQSVKVKKPKISSRTAETEPLVLGVEASLEAADFQTVTNKKKIRKRHSPADEGRGKVNGNGGNSHGHGNHNKNGRFNGNFNTHDRDTSKRNVERRHTSVSSPPSDSNDDLESVHSMCGEVTGERVQASYADMARAASQRLPTTAPPPVPAPATSPPPPPPPPNLVTPAPQRLHNFPDLIESCNYYSNERNIHDKYLDVSTENTKNLMLKESSPVEAAKTRGGGCSNIVDAGTQVEGTANPASHPIYSHEQYPALEPRQRGVANGKNPNHKTSSAGVTGASSNHSSSNNSKTVVVKPSGAGGGGNADKRPLTKANSLKDSCIMSHEHETGADYYVAYVEHSTTNNSLPHECDSYTDNSNTNTQISFSCNDSNQCKMDNFVSKPPDVVLPIAEMNQIQTDNNNRPPVIILNEELKKSSDNIRDIDGITFGFDINEQLLNGDSTSSNCNMSDNPTTTDNSDVSSSSLNNNACMVTKEVSTMLIYNSAEFPPIKDQHQRSRRSTSVCEAEDSSGGVGVLHVGSSKALRFLPPPDNSYTPKDMYNLERLVHYVGMAWEDTIKSPGGKVRYFSE